MVDTKGKYRLVEIGALKPGDLFSVSLEMEDEQYRVSKIRLFSQPEYIIGVGIETGCKLGWRKDCPVYVREGTTTTTTHIVPSAGIKSEQATGRGSGGSTSVPVAEHI